MICELFREDWQNCRKKHLLKLDRHKIPNTYIEVIDSSMGRFLRILPGRAIFRVNP